MSAKIICAPSKVGRSKEEQIIRNVFILFGLSLPQGFF